MKQKTFEGTLIAKPDDKLPMGKAALLGLQHVLAMDVYVVPFIIASALALSVADSAIVIQSAFIAAGIATLIQSQLFVRLPVVQGPSYIPIGAVLAIAFSAGGGMTGLSAVYGALIPGALIVIFLGKTKVFHRIIGRLVPPLVGGTIIIVVGIALIPVALRDNIFAVHGTGSISTNILFAATSASVLIIAMMTGLKLGSHGTWLRLSSVLLALLAGCGIAALFGQFTLNAVSEANWLTPPRIAGLSFPLTFSLPSIFTIAVVYMVLLAEATGTWFAVTAIINDPLQDKQLDRGAIGEGLGSMIGALIGSTPMTGYSSNAGIIAITGIASRMAFAAAGILLIAFGLLGKLSAAIASIPVPVVGGVFAVLCAVIAMNGIRIIRNISLDERNMLVIGLPIVFALFVTLAPPEFIKTLPELIQYFFGSSVAVGAIAAILLHQLLPEQSQ